MQHRSLIYPGEMSEMAIREWSSIATRTYSQPMPWTVARWLPVTRCEGPMRPSFLVRT